MMSSVITDCPDLVLPNVLDKLLSTQMSRDISLLRP